MRAQVSVEYILVVGLAFLILVPTGYLIFTFSKGQIDRVSAAQINKAGLNIVNTAESMYTSGTNSWTTIRVSFPESVTNVRASGKEVTIAYETQSGPSDAVFFSKVNLTTPYGGNVSQNFTAGFTELRVKSLGDTVEVREHIG